MTYGRFGNYRASDRSTVGTALTFLFIGLGVGALAALLFAPKTGSQMRRLLRRKYDDAVDGADELMERGSEWASEVKDRVAPLGKIFDR